MPRDPSAKAVLLAEINAGLPALDWKQGARRYVQGFFDRYSREQIEAFIHTKPLAAVTPEDPAGSLQEGVSYLFNFASMLQLLALPRGSRVLDVACGGGWVSHWLMKLGYAPTGCDISAEFIDLARARVARDPDLHVTPAELKTTFLVHDVEAEPLPEALQGRFEAVVLESCLHHFFNPVSALRHLRAALAPDGVVLIIEGENRRGPLRPEYLAVMEETSTLERPYARSQLVRAMELAGLPHHVFLGTVEGYAPEQATGRVSELFAANAAGRNTCVSAATLEALDRIVPRRGEAPSPSASPAKPEPQPFQPPAAQEPSPAPLTPLAPPSAMVHLGTAVKLASPAWARPVLAGVWRLLRRRESGG